MANPIVSAARKVSELISPVFSHTWKFSTGRGGTVYLDQDYPTVNRDQFEKHRALIGEVLESEGYTVTETHENFTKWGGKSTPSSDVPHTITFSIGARGRPSVYVQSVNYPHKSK